MSKFAEDCLRGNNILITGAMGAIGRVVVAELLRHGADLIANDIVPEEKAREIASQAGWPGRWRYNTADITLAADVSRLIEACEEGRNLEVALPCGHGRKAPDSR
jgi:NAD(P)-dependent dehydrogenase (short-subunit alcohol dehydrogenase family)